MAAMRRRGVHLVVLSFAALFADDVRALEMEDSSFFGEIEQPPISYTSTPVDDPIARLQKRLAAGELKLTYDEHHGYLPSMLAALKVDASSQVLVFSKTSFQADRINPHHPRALYFNDSVYVGEVRGGGVLELAAQDPKQGTIFYTLDQYESGRPVFKRQISCLQCHQSQKTLGVPGPFVRSVFPDSAGFPLLQGGSFTTNHRSPLEHRWGGWYVTGTHGRQKHMGNIVAPDKERPEDMDMITTGLNVTSLGDRFDTTPYLTAYSDIVALMVLEHQTHMQNLFTRADFESRTAMEQQRAINAAMNQPAGTVSDTTRSRIRSAGEAVVRYMLMADEVYLTDPVSGPSDYAKDFMARGPRDKRGRSLRELDLKKWLFSYPCSFMIYSEQYDRLDGAVKEFIERRLFDILSGKFKSDLYAMSEEKRGAILEILRETKPSLPAYWRSEK
jgi:hypothetical protein